MDNHPIPQDVTGFQFRLIGSMTVKQFAYLATGCGLAFIMYYFPVHVLFKVVLIPLFAGTGFAIAFIPLEGRPLDAMIGFYLKALLSPNQYIYQKNTAHLSFNDTFRSAPPVRLPIAVQKGSNKESATVKKQQLKSYLHQTTHKSLSASDQTEEQFLTTVTSQASEPLMTQDHASLIMPQAYKEPTETPAEPEEKVTAESQDVKKEAAMPEPKSEKEEADKDQLVPPLPSFTMNVEPIHTSAIITENSEELLKQQKENEQKEEALRKEEELLAKQKEEAELEQKRKAEELAEKEAESHKVKEESQQTHAKLLEMERSLQEMLSQKQSMEQELQRMKEQLSKAQPSTNVYQPTIAKDVPKKKTNFVTQLPQELAKKKGLPPTPDAPNILLGIVKDSSENILPNILIEVKDKEGNPVRAFKTNQLGQFASATPLNNGTYTIDFEDATGKHKFDTIELVAKGEILSPMEVISHDLREELRKQLFT